MPSRNVIKVYVEDSYYHVYNRGVSKQAIFLDDADYIVFTGLLKRYLSPYIEKQANRVAYPSFAGDVSLMAHCLMPNHFHLLLHQKSRDGMKGLLKCLSVSYSMYFNKKYKHVGAVFQQRYRAVRIIEEAQFANISRYIHMNPDGYRTWRWSSLPYYIDSKTSSWLVTDKLPDVGDYQKFLDDYRDKRHELRDIEDELAGTWQ